MSVFLGMESGSQFPRQLLLDLLGVQRTFFDVPYGWEVLPKIASGRPKPVWASQMPT